jgi:putative transcriptional regulator
MDKEMQQFQDDFLASVRQMKEGKKSRITTAEPTLAALARAKVAMTQVAFSQLLGISVRTLQEWEQGRRSPSYWCCKNITGYCDTKPHGFALIEPAVLIITRCCVKTLFITSYFKTVL